MRACINMDQGGAIVDLRPYVSKLDWKVGIGTEHIQDASYPYIIQEKYRAGYFTHYAGEGTIRSAKVCYKGEEIDLCLCRTHAHFKQVGNSRNLVLDPVEIEFNDLTIKRPLSSVFVKNLFVSDFAPLKSFCNKQLASLFGYSMLL